MGDGADLAGMCVQMPPFVFCVCAGVWKFFVPMFSVQLFITSSADPSSGNAVLDVDTTNS